MNTSNENKLWDYADGLLDESEMAACRLWLSKDAEARKFLKQITNLKGGLKHIPQEHPAADFTMQIMEALSEEKGLEVKSVIRDDRWIIRSIVAFFLLIICSGIGVLMYFGSGSEIRHFTTNQLLPGEFSISRFYQNKGMKIAFEIVEVMLALLATERLFKRFIFKHASA